MGSDTFLYYMLILTDNLRLFDILVYRVFELQYKTHTHRLAEDEYKYMFPYDFVPRI